MIMNSNLKNLILGELNIDQDYSDDYLIYTDSERQESLKDYIKESVWSFNPEFILDHNSKIMNNTTDREYFKILDSIKKTQYSLCEDCNELMLALIDNFDDFCQDAVDADGYGHFLSGYDGEELEIEYQGITYYIYRQN